MCRTSQDIICMENPCNACHPSPSPMAAKIRSQGVGFIRNGQWDDGSDFAGAVPAMEILLAENIRYLWPVVSCSMSMSCLLHRQFHYTLSQRMRVFTRIPDLRWSVTKSSSWCTKSIAINANTILFKPHFLCMLIDSAALYNYRSTYIARLPNAR